MYSIIYIYIYIYIYISKVKLVTVVKDDPKAPFLLRSVGESTTPFLGLLYLPLILTL